MVNYLVLAGAGNGPDSPELRVIIVVCHCPVIRLMRFQLLLFPGRRRG